MIRTPHFWSIPHHPVSVLLQPAAGLWDGISQLRRRLTRSIRTPIPSICAGNATIGGAGKTPVVMALAEMLRQSGAHPAIGLRGYGARIAPGVTRVDPARHTARETGDEALLLAQVAPCYVSRDRYAASLAAYQDGATHILFDDGLQNPQIDYDIALLVIDGAYGIGNGKIIPAGPLREDWLAALGRCQALVMIGGDDTDLLATAASALTDKILLSASLVAEIPAGLSRTEKFLAFAGIGRPEKFFQTCRDSGLELVAMKSFPDHHSYAAAELETLERQAQARGARLITTAKDAVRLPPEYRKRIAVLPVRLQLTDPGTLLTLLPKLQ